MDMLMARLSVDKTIEESKALLADIAVSPHALRLLPVAVRIRHACTFRLAHTQARRQHRHVSHNGTGTESNTCCPPT